MIAYAITSPLTLQPTTIQNDIKRFAKKADMIVYRDKTNHAYPDDAKRFISEARAYDFEKVLLHRDVKLSKLLGADGVHLTSGQLREIAPAKEEGLFVVVSTHRMGEAIEAENLGADMVTFSPVFQTPGKGEPVGLEQLSKVINALNIPVIALGGIMSQSEIKMCQMAGAKGFASIRYFA